MGTEVPIKYRDDLEELLRKAVLLRYLRDRYKPGAAIFVNGENWECVSHAYWLGGEGVAVMVREHRDAMTLWEYEIPAATLEDVRRSFGF